LNTSIAAEPDLERAWKVLREGIAQRVFPGAAAAITLTGELIALRGFGRLTYEENVPEVTGETIFDVASLTKVMAATSMAMVLYERGVLDLEARVAAIVPEFVGGGERGSVTVRHLLSHTSGLPAYEKLFAQAHTREELIAAACRAPLVARPGDHVEYSDIGFIVLGAVLERLADEPIDTFCAREIFGPLGLSRTGYRPPSEWREQIPPTEDDRAFRQRAIQGEVHDENASVMGGVSAHAGLFAPAADVARFAEWMLHGGTPILRPDTVKLFTSPQPVRSGNARALGWDRVSQPSQSGRYFSGSAYGHLGFTGTSLWIDPERRLSVTMLTNRTWPHRESQPIKQLRPGFHDAVMQALGFART
jgi:CubicO group peptidase (beta-lactamase class C family)